MSPVHFVPDARGRLLARIEGGTGKGNDVPKKGELSRRGPTTEPPPSFPLSSDFCSVPFLSRPPSTSHAPATLVMPAPLRLAPLAPLCPLCVAADRPPPFLPRFPVSSLLLEAYFPLPHSRFLPFARVPPLR